MEGADKAWLEVDGEAIAERQLRTLRSLCDEVAIVVGQSGAAGALEIPVLVDVVGGKGPMDGIAAGLRWSPSEWLLVLAGDMPRVEAALLRRLLRERRPGLAAIAPRALGRIQPLVACYHRSLLPAMLERLEQGNLSVTGLFSDPPATSTVRLVGEEDVRMVDPELRSFENWNRPKEVLRSDGRIE